MVPPAKDAGSIRPSATAASVSASRVFFFQAEDGIRGGTVTGVQTCALPIYVSRPLGASAAGLQFLRTPPVNPSYALREFAESAIRRHLDPEPETELGVRLAGIRSEERRVGKEGRSRREQQHDRTKKSRKEDS